MFGFFFFFLLNYITQNAFLLINSKDAGSSLFQPNSPSPSYSEAKPAGGSLLNGPHSYTQATDGIKVHTHTQKLHSDTFMDLRHTHAHTHTH